MKHKFEEEQEKSRNKKKRKKHFRPYKKDKYSLSKLNGYNDYLNDMDLLSN